MNTIRWKQTGLIMALIGAASLSPAGNPDGRGPGSKGSGNRERDGERPSREERMERFDTDGDGQLSEEEREAMREAIGKRRGRGGQRPNREALLEKYDKDGDGQLSEKERRRMQKDRRKMEKERQKKQQDKA